jgi:hypothetical protein
MLDRVYPDTPPPQNTIKGRYTIYTLCSTPGKESQALFNTVVLFPNSVLHYPGGLETYLYHIHPPPPSFFGTLVPAFRFRNTPRHFLFWVPIAPYIFFCYIRPVGENGLAPLDFDLLLNCIRTLLYGAPTPPLHGVP